MVAEEFALRESQSNDAPPRDGNIRWLAGSLLAGTGVAIAALAYGFFIEPRRLTVEEVCLPVPHLAPPLEGYRIAQLSDLHCGASRNWLPHLRRAVQKANGLRADLIVLTGDLVDRTSDVSACVQALSGLHARHGIIAVLGNHDYYGSPRRPGLLVQALRDRGMVVLRNEIYSVAAGVPLHIVGLDDAHTGHEKLVQVLNLLPRQRGVRLLLSHYPDVVERLSPGTCDLVLAGHAHGGQIRLPLLTHLARRYHVRTAYSHGLYHVDGTPLYVNRGLGMLFPQARFLSPPEVTCLTLRAAKPPSS